MERTAECKFQTIREFHFISHLINLILKVFSSRVMFCHILMDLLWNDSFRNTSLRSINLFQPSVILEINLDPIIKSNLIFRRYNIIILYRIYDLAIFVFTNF